MAKVLCVLYDDPVTGYQKSYARHYAEDRTLSRWADHTNTQAIDFTPGALLGSVTGELGLRDFVQPRGHRLVVTSDKDGLNSGFERELVDAEIGRCQEVRGMI